MNLAKFFLFDFKKSLNFTINREIRNLIFFVTWFVFRTNHTLSLATLQFLWDARGAKSVTALRKNERLVTIEIEIFLTNFAFGTFHSNYTYPLLYLPSINSQIDLLIYSWNKSNILKSILIMTSKRVCPSIHHRMKKI